MTAGWLARWLLRRAARRVQLRRVVNPLDSLPGFRTFDTLVYLTTVAAAAFAFSELWSCATLGSLGTAASSFHLWTTVTFAGMHLHQLAKLLVAVRVGSLDFRLSVAVAVGGFVGALLLSYVPAIVAAVWLPCSAPQRRLRRSTSLRTALRSSGGKGGCCPFGLL